ncbi:6-phosphogluconate dehydrogenase C-terminal domain-like protein [Acephala macrosclerotiorum]|nr:6-phosphogluconate dehydrogenase C-terminal domain-like protein [Acephala macrosclerotiorum]
MSDPGSAILSMGEMGLGIASLLVKYSYPVITNLDGRSAATKARAKAVGVKDAPFDQMLSQASVVLSVLPPGEALALAEKAAASLLFSPLSRYGKGKLVYIDLNAISPSLSRKISARIIDAGMTFIDGCVLAYPPKEMPDGSWFRPSIPLSGPSLSTAIPDPWSSELTSLLNFRHVSPDIGAASGLKMCFAAVIKGQTAIAIQAYTTASNLGVLASVREHMAEYFPHVVNGMEGAMVGSQKKAYRWIKEMEEIEECFVTEGGWDKGIFEGAADVFRVVKKCEVQSGIEGMVSSVSGGLRARRKSC